MSVATILVPPIWSAARTFTWPVKAATDRLPRAIDFSDWLAANELALIDVPVVTPDATLTAVLLSAVDGVITLRLDGGLAGTSPAVTLRLPLSGGAFVSVIVTQPIDGLPAVLPVPAPAVRQVLNGSSYAVPAGAGLVRFTQPVGVGGQLVTLPGSAAADATIQMLNYAGAIGALMFSPVVWGWSNGAPLPAWTGLRIRYDATILAWVREQ